MMTDEQKRMKKYTNSIERRLNLPLKVKERVMSDLISSIAARREAGMTDEEIYMELGSPQKVADELNEQMKEFAYRKSPWRIVFLAAALYGGTELLGGLIPNMLYLLMRLKAYFAPGEDTSIGIIGGADGPTAIFVTTPVWTSYVVPIVLVVVGIWGYLRLRKSKQK